MYEITPDHLLFWVALLQGIFYLLTGLWGVVHRSSFEQVTGPKTDYWLVRTVGALVAVTGIVLLVAVSQERLPLEVFLLAVSNAAALTAIDVVYVTRERIARVYLLDAATEVVLIVAWLIGWGYLIGVG